MKTFISISAATLLALTLQAPAQAHENHGQPMYGGVVAEAVEAQFELVPQGNKAVVYVTQHGVPQSTTGASGKLTVLSGANKTEAELKPAGQNRMEAALAVPPGAKALITIQLLGKKPLTGRAAF